MAGLKAQPVDASAGWWNVLAIEAYEHRAANLVLCDQIIGQDFVSNRLDRLARLPEGATGTLDSAAVQAELSRLVGTGDLAAVVQAYSLATLAGRDDQLAAVVESSWRGLRDMTDGGGPPIFPKSEVHLLHVSDMLPHRFAFARAFLRFQDDPSLLEHRPAATGELNFASSVELFSDTTLGLDAYLDPLFLALSPWMWGFDGARKGGVVVYSLGKAVSGRRSHATELLQLHTPRGSLQGGPGLNDVTPQAISSALSWWAKRLNRLFSEITDPANYQDQAGFYQPRPHFEVLLGFEQFFRHVGSTLGQVRDQNAQRLLFFSALDTLDGLGGIGLHEAFSIDKAEAVLRFVEADMGAEEQTILLPNARRAVEGLRSVQNGFFLPSRVTNSGVVLPEPDGTDRQFSKAEAAALWLQVLRNATHGFRSKRSKHQRRGEALLMAHNGAIPEGLALLPYLYLLQLLSDPIRVNRMVRSAARSASPAQAP